MNPCEETVVARQPLKIPRKTLEVVSQIAELLEPLTDEQRAFVLRTLIALALPASELQR